jgi:hypothetical protein
MRAAAWLLIGAITTGCESKKEETTTARVAPPAASSAQPASPESLALAVNEEGTATFLIDAPLEKIKGKADRFRGKMNVKPDRLDETRGQIDVDLSTLATHTFDDEGKNAKQTEHAHNWLELGTDVEEKQRTENQWVRFTIESVTVTPSKLDDAKEAEGHRRVELSAKGQLWLHGVTSQKTVKLAALFSGPADAPTSVQVTTLEPLRISLKEHDVKPRDVAGKFLKGALEQVGEKIVDEVQVSFDFTAKPAGDP